MTTAVPAPTVHGPTVHGPTVDDQTRCVHYRTELDVIAIRFACCGRYYPCHLCHDGEADHDSRPWPTGSDHKRAVLCGVCRTELTIAEYRVVPSCPECSAPFNPRCAAHYPVYFE
ncbi:CHY zinc finger protein [Promicromonospora sp. Populi]|uniref:CHY zinc finger protein n=1 Tax=Promicromonospora sp. Populi TaxID=3239420 RepID=UPI0034E212C5